MAATHFSGPIVLGSGSVETLDAADTLTAADSGKVFFLDGTVGATVTLPTGAAGMRFKFVVASTFITSNWVVASAEGDNISGFISDMGTTVAVVVAGAEDQINFVATAETVGDWIELVWDNANSQWLVSGACGANGGITATDPA